MVQRGDPVPSLPTTVVTIERSVDMGRSRRKGQSPSVGMVGERRTTCARTGGVPREQTTVEAAVREEWNVLRAVTRTWGVTSQEQLTDWMVRQGLPRVSNHVAARAPRSSS